VALSAVIRTLHPGDDRDAEVFTGIPGAAVQDVLLDQGEERFYGCVITCCTDSSHRSDHAGTG